MMFSSNNDVAGKNNFGVNSLDDLSQLFILYGVGFALVFLCYSVMYWRAEKKDIENEKELSNYKRHFFIFVMIAIVSIIMAAANIGVRYGIPGFVYALLGPLCHFHAKWSERKYGV
ncbi:MAG TPA: hypothetical protein ENJ95_09825 [Bacteroidetes bacterium]|nr:hypothetical protein [Bacteroidota bacterium]